VFRHGNAAGSAKINAVSGASYTSAGYIQSLQSALDAARAAGVDRIYFYRLLWKHGLRTREPSGREPEDL
jgi:hypothetical protein